MGHQYAPRIVHDPMTACTVYGCHSYGEPGELPPGGMFKVGKAIAAPYRNPADGSTNWYHGTSWRPDEDDDEYAHEGGTVRPPEETSPAWGMEAHDRANEHWNTDLGSHFSSLRSVAEGFARKGAREDARVLTAGLHMANPKHYPSEHDMTDEAINWAHKRYPFVSDPDDEDEQDYREDHLARPESAPEIDDYGTKYVGDNTKASHVQAKEEWLAHHPDREEVTTGFRKHLQDQGYDGITYGNEYEGPKGHISAIAFPDTPIHHRRWTWMSKEVDDRHHHAPQNRFEHVPGQTQMQYAPHPQGGVELRANLRQEHTAALDEVGNTEHPHVDQYRSGGIGHVPGDETRSVVGFMPVGTIARYRVHDGDQNGQHSRETVQRIRSDIRSGVGITNPIVIDYDHDAGWGYIGEGNHRLQAARQEGLQTVPVRVYGRSHRGAQMRQEGSGAPLHPVSDFNDDPRYSPPDIHPAMLAWDGQHTAAAKEDPYTFRHIVTRSGGGWTGHTVAAFGPGDEVHSVVSWGGSNPRNEVNSLWTHPEHRREGLATRVLGKAREVNPSLQHSPERSEEGNAFAKATGDDIPRRRRISTPEEAERQGRSTAAVAEGQYAGDTTFVLPLSITELGQHRKNAVLDDWFPTERLFAPTKDNVDPKLFDQQTNQMLPEVREEVLAELDEFFDEHGYGDPDGWARIYLAGSQASKWWSNRDFDLLVGINYQVARQQVPAFADKTDDQIDSLLNTQFREDFNQDGWHPAFDPTEAWDRTAYVNKNSWDIAQIKPYAAYNITDNTWAVKPIDEPTGHKWDATERYYFEGVAAQARSALAMREPLRTRRASAIWDFVHSDRSRAFGPHGTGAFDYRNAVEKYLDQAPSGIPGKSLMAALADVRFGRTGSLRNPEMIQFPHAKRGKQAEAASVQDVQAMQGIQDSREVRGHQERLQGLPQQGAGRTDEGSKERRHASHMRQVWSDVSGVSDDQDDRLSGVLGEVLPRLSQAQGSRGSGVSREATQGISESLSEEDLRDHDRAVRGDARTAGWEVRDLRSDGRGIGPGQHVRGPQPQDGRGAGTAVRDVQLRGAQSGGRRGVPAEGAELRAQAQRDVVSGKEQKTAARQYPVYEVGDPEEYTNPNYHVRNYGPADKVHPSAFGMEIREDYRRDPRERRERHHPAIEEDVPLHKVWGSQDYVYAPHVRNLAKVPGKDMEPIGGSWESDGTFQTDDHHRVAAALLRGDTHIRARVDSSPVGHYSGKQKTVAARTSGAHDGNDGTGPSSYYHGTRHELRPGQVLEGGHGKANQGYGQPADHVYFSGRHDVASYFAEAGNGPKGHEDARPRVYKVEPIGSYEQDPDEDEEFDSHRARRVRVLHEVPYSYPHHLAAKTVADPDFGQHPRRPLFQTGDRVIAHGKFPGTVHHVQESLDAGSHPTVWVNEDGREGEIGINQAKVELHSDASEASRAHHARQVAKDQAKIPYVPTSERDVDEDDRVTVHHLTGDPHFAPSAAHRPANNTTLGGDLSPRLFVGDPTSWSEGQYGYKRPYVAELSVPRKLVHTDGGYLGEGEIHARNFGKIKVQRVIPYDAYDREQYGAIGRAEEYHGTAFDTGKKFTDQQLRDNQHGKKVFPDGYRWEGDTRDWTQQQHRDYVTRHNQYLKGAHDWDIEDDHDWGTHHESVLRRQAAKTAGANGPDYQGLTFHHHSDPDAKTYLRGDDAMEVSAHHPEHGQVGSLSYTPHGGYVEVNYMYVPDEHTRRGVGSALMDELHRHTGDDVAIQHGGRTEDGEGWADSYFGPHGEDARGRKVAAIVPRGADYAAWLRHTAMPWYNNQDGIDSAKAKPVKAAGYAGYVGNGDSDDEMFGAGTDDDFDEDLYDRSAPEPTEHERAHYEEHGEYPDSYLDRHDEAYGQALERKRQEDVPDHQDPDLHEFVGEHGSNNQFWHDHATLGPVDLTGPVYATQSHVNQQHIDRYLADPKSQAHQMQISDRYRQIHEKNPYLADEHPMFVTHQGRLHVTDGHHRVAAALQGGKHSIVGWHYDADKHGFPDEDGNWGEQAHTAARTAIKVTALGEIPWYAKAPEAEIDAHPAADQIREQNLGSYTSPAGHRYRLVRHAGRMVSAHYLGREGKPDVQSPPTAGYVSWFAPDRAKKQTENTVTDRFNPYAHYDKDARGTIYKAHVEQQHRRRGVASALLDFAREGVPYPIDHSHALTEDGKAWSAKKVGLDGDLPRRQRVVDSTEVHPDYRRRSVAQQTWNRATRVPPEQTGQAKRAAQEPQYGPRPEYDPDVDMDTNRAAEHQWRANTRRGLSLGHLTGEQAHDLGYTGVGHDQDGHGGLSWHRLPHDLWHVTTDAPAVHAHGLATRDELGQQFGKGLGGGESDTISFTDDKHTADNILDSLHEYHRVLTGKKTPQDMYREAKEGVGADHPYHDFIHSVDGYTGENDPRLQAHLHGREFEQGLANRSEHPDWEPVGNPLGGPSHDPLHHQWTRPATDQEKRRRAASMYRSFAAGREYAGGRPDPSFFQTDLDGLAHSDPAKFQVMHFHPKPGAQGYRVNALGEWRTATGDAVTEHQPEHQPDNEHADQAGKIGAGA